MDGKSYLAAFQNKRLNEVVIPGSHDAGIYQSGKSNVRTQGVDIGKQAEFGCRFFDMRIAGRKGSDGQVTNTSFHLGGGIISHKVKDQGSITKSHNVRHLGGWGGRLDDMLGQAKLFVQSNGTEFLILKFSKCKNWESIAEACAAHLGDLQYKDGGNLNTKYVKELKGKVITVFDEEAGPELSGFIRKQATPVTVQKINDVMNGGKLGHGVLFIRALYNKDAALTKGYDPNFWGLQYYGKFSDTPDVKTNTKKQQALLEGGAATHIDALGMMYWTTTGLLGNIKKRNAKMWTQTNIAALQKTWNAGLESAITSRLGREMNSVLALGHTTGGALGGRLKAFMPNIVMMDFVDADKCKVVYDLNGVASTALLKLLIPTPTGPQGTPDPTASFTSLSQMRR